MALISLQHLAHRSSPKVEFSTKDIVSTLKSLQTNFKEMEKEQYDSCQKRKQEHDKVIQALQSKIKFMTNDLDETVATYERKDQEKKTAEKHLGQEDKEMKADQGFLEDLTAECEVKAKQWDLRSQTRSDELTAISKALEKLKGKGSEMFNSANKKLVGLQVASQPKLRGTKLSFLQVQ